jgi:cytohesin
VRVGSVTKKHKTIFLLLFTFVILLVGGCATALHQAVKENDIETVRKLIDQGADVNATTSGNTPLFWAGDNKAIAELLIAKGANVNARNWHGTTPLLGAVTLHHWGVAELLISKGADVNAKGEREATPLLLAAQHPPTAEMLILKGADVNAKDKDGHTPLHAAAFGFGGEGLTKLLIDKGADVNAKDWYGETPLHVAAYGPFDRKDIAELLIDKGADINAKTEAQWTPLLMAIFKGNERVAELLISKGADVNAMAGGATALHWAANSGSRTIAELLIAKGANPSVKTRGGRTPSMIAQEKGYAAIATLLKEAEEKESMRSR